MNSVLRYELDDFGKIGVTLESFNSLEEMDLFMKKFRDSNDVKEKYLDKINDFLKSNAAIGFMKIINGKENNGYLRGYTKYNNRFTHVPIIYQRSLINEKDCFIRLRTQLPIKRVLNEIYYRKSFLLPSSPTMFLRHELCHAVVHNGTSRIFIKEFISYISKLTPSERYFVFRCLADKCHLLDEEKEKITNHFKIRRDDNGYRLVKTRSYPIGDYSDEEIEEMIDQDDEVSLRKDADEEFLDQFDYNDISEMLENFDIDEIDRNTNYFDNLNKKRGRK